MAMSVDLIDMEKVSVVAGVSYSSVISFPTNSREILNSVGQIQEKCLTQNVGHKDSTG